MESTRTCATRKPTNSTPHTHRRRLSPQEGGQGRHPRWQEGQDRRQHAPSPKPPSLPNKQVQPGFPSHQREFITHTSLFPSPRPALVQKMLGTGYTHKTVTYGYDGSSLVLSSSPPSYSPPSYSPPLLSRTLFPSHPHSMRRLRPRSSMPVGPLPPVGLGGVWALHATR